LKIWSQTKTVDYFLIEPLGFSSGKRMIPHLLLERESQRRKGGRQTAALPTVRLNNGARYVFERSDDLGAPQDFRMIFYFGNNQAVRIDTDSIVEIMEVD
jgi:hypothetical protein